MISVEINMAFISYRVGIVGENLGYDFGNQFLIHLVDALGM
jgi:hypothetical protein